MACPAVGTGERFVAQMLAHIDCQAQSIGAYGYGALADPNSPASAALTAMLAIFIAIFGLRLMLGTPVAGRDVVGDIVKIGVVLTLATSWPAWRVVGYDLVMKAPSELSGAIGNASGLPGSDGDLAARLQSADDGIVMLTVYGTGRNVGGINRSDTIGDTFRGIALADQEGLSNGRLWFLVGVLAPLAIVKLGAGLLLALAPLMAGLLLFVGTRDLFFGWLRGLFLVAVGALALGAVYGVELAILAPWVRDAVAMREGQILTPSAPTELSVITLVFAAASFGILGILVKIAFFGGFGIPRLIVRPTIAREDRRLPANPVVPALPEAPPSRAYQISEAVAHTLRQEERSRSRSLGLSDSVATVTSGGTGRALRVIDDTSGPLGSSFRASSGRNYRRASGAAGRRDRKL